MLCTPSRRHEVNVQTNRGHRKTRDAGRSEATRDIFNMAAREEDYLAVEVKVKYNRHKHFLFHYGHPMYDYRSKYSK